MPPSATRRLACVTGASAGIGATFARELAARGFDLLLVARRRERLDELAAELRRDFGVAAAAMAADLADPAQMEAVAQRLEASPELELLVNNAGFGSRGLFQETPLERQMEMHQLHVMATVRLSRAALAPLTAGNRGGIINVSSVAAFVRSAHNTSYCATKSWMLVFSEGLALDLAKAGSAVRVQALCPGFTYSEFHDVLGVDRALIPRNWWMTAEFVVEESLRGWEAGKLFVIPGWRYRALVAVLTKLPASWRVAMEKWSPHRRGRD